MKFPELFMALFDLACFIGLLSLGPIGWVILVLLAVNQGGN